MKKISKPLIAVSMAVILIIVFFTVTISTMMNTNKVTNQKEDIILTQIEKRAELTPEIIQIIKKHMDFESYIYDDVKRLQEELTNAETVEDKIIIDAELFQSVKKLIVAVDGYPELANDVDYKKFLENYVTISNKVQTSYNDYESSIIKYNKLVKSFPTNISAFILNYKVKMVPALPVDENEVHSLIFS